jgi:two-component system, LytTR family, sensor kinase
MKAGLGRLFANTAFRLVLVLWTFGYILVELAATLQGRNVAGLMLLTNLPLLALGVSLSLALNRLLDRFGDRYVLKWIAVAIAVVTAGWVQTWADLLWLRTVALMVFPEWQEWALNLSVQV